MKREGVEILSTLDRLIRESVSDKVIFEQRLT